MSLSAKIKKTALDIGFDLVGITTSNPISDGHKQFLENWIKQGLCGDMGYMSRNFDKRTNPSMLLEGAKSIVCVGLNYKLNSIDEETLEKNQCKICRYAVYEDYHKFIKDRLYLLAMEIEKIAEKAVRYKVCVDSVPLAERAIAERAGLGFVGKNHILINPQKGLQILLGELITDLELQNDAPIENQCNRCDKCIKACPTGALSANGKFDATKCISYLTIESKDKIDEKYNSVIGNKLFGCDECIKACPFDNFAPVAENSDFKPLKKLLNINIEQIEQLDTEAFNKLFTNTAIHRRGLEKLKLNLHHHRFK